MARSPRLADHRAFATACQRTIVRPHAVRGRNAECVPGVESLLLAAVTIRRNAEIAGVPASAIRWISRSRCCYDDHPGGRLLDGPAPVTNQRVSLFLGAPQEQSPKELEYRRRITFNVPSQRSEVRSRALIVG